MQLGVRRTRVAFCVKIREIGRLASRTNAARRKMIFPGDLDTSPTGANISPECHEQRNRPDDHERNGGGGEPFGGVSAGVSGPSAERSWNRSGEKEDGGNQSTDYRRATG